MGTTDKLPSRLHHNAFVSKDLEATRAFDPDLTPSPFRHIALKVTPELQQEIHDRRSDAAWKPDGTYVLEHGYCRSLYTEDPNGLLLEFTADVEGADEIAADRRADAHETLKRWLDGDHTSNNVYR